MNANSKKNRPSEEGDEAASAQATQHQQRATDSYNEPNPKEGFVTDVAGGAISCCRWLNSKWNNFVDCLRCNYEFILAISTAVLAVIAYFQYDALVKTDRTIDRQNELTRLRDRAFVYFEGITAFEYPPNAATVWGLQAQINNAGSIAARDVRVRFACPRHQKNDEDPFAIAVKWFSLEAPNAIGPKQTIGPFWLAGCDIPIATVTEAKVSKIHIYMALELTYFDGFEMIERRVTRMGRAFRFDQLGGRRLGFAGQNCSDDDCPK